MTVGTLLYEGKAKKVFATDKPDQVVQYFKDDATAFNAQKRGTIVEKGVVNTKVSERLFRLLEQAGVPTHFVERLSDRELLTKKVTIVPVEVVVRNVVAGSLAKRLGLKGGDPIEPAIVEWYYKNDALGDPLIADEHIRLMKLATPEHMTEIKRLALKVNSVLAAVLPRAAYDSRGFQTGIRVHNGTLILADEISPDTCRFWDQTTKESMDKDRFRKDLGKIEEAYQEVLRRVCG